MLPQVDGQIDHLVLLSHEHDLGAFDLGRRLEEHSSMTQAHPHRRRVENERCPDFVDEASAAEALSRRSCHQLL
jgi:hypothetical protein